ncbi:MAG: phosphate/phosphite/phosphonate ABC transporter substrate-binding protein [bacterium]|nr:PhnD/SsuA/transferrin family substrate-binding protein [Betaproteobacteria bacterium]
MADNAEPFARDVAAALGRTLQLPVEFVADRPWPERERALHDGEVHVGWLCGLPYVQEAARARPRFELLAAPVMRGARYAARPVYFSDLVVRDDHPARCLAHLQGATVAINEPNSHSGYGVLRHALARAGLPHGFFGTVVESGAHQRSLELIEAGKVDAAAIDSTVLETELRAAPTRRAGLRSLATFGPSPIPPWVAASRLPRATRAALRTALLALPFDTAAEAAFERAQVLGFAQVDDAWYDPIREMARTAATYPLPVARAA